MVAPGCAAGSPFEPGLNPLQSAPQSLPARTWLFQQALAWARTKSSASSGPAAWGRSIARAIRAWAATAILRDDPPDLSLVRGDIPPALEHIVRHCLEKRPGERFQSTRDLRSTERRADREGARFPPGSLHRRRHTVERLRTGAGRRGRRSPDRDHAGRPFVRVHLWPFLLRPLPGDRSALVREFARLSVSASRRYSSSRRCRRSPGRPRPSWCRARRRS